MPADTNKYDLLTGSVTCSEANKVLVGGVNPVDDEMLTHRQMHLESFTSDGRSASMCYVSISRSCACIYNSVI